MEVAMVVYGVAFAGFMYKAAKNSDVSRHTRSSISQKVAGGF